EVLEDGVRRLAQDGPAFEGRRRAVEQTGLPAVVVQAIIQRGPGLRARLDESRAQPAELESQRAVVVEDPEVSRDGVVAPRRQAAGGPERPRDAPVAPDLPDARRQE